MARGFGLTCSIAVVRVRQHSAEWGQNWGRTRLHTKGITVRTQKMAMRVSSRVHCTHSPAHTCVTVHLSLAMRVCLRVCWSLTTPSGCQPCTVDKTHHSARSREGVVQGSAG